MLEPTTVCSEGAVAQTTSIDKLDQDMPGRSSTTLRIARTESFLVVALKLQCMCIPPLTSSTTPVMYAD